jgi:hypothetical protein
MKLTQVLASLSGAVAAVEVFPWPLSNQVDTAKIPTSYESAVMGRRILALSKLGTLSTVFPATDSNDAGPGTWEHRPDGLDGVPIGLVDYVADCEGEGNPTILAIDIATSFKNVRDGSNITMSMRWAPPYPPARRMSLISRLSAHVPFLGTKSPYNSGVEPDHAPDPFPYSVANLPRFALVGYLEPIDPDAVASVRLAACFTSKHPDAKWWLPGNVIHKSEWVRLVVTHVYWIGGFGDRAYIGWIPLDEWQNVTKDEWSDIRLPGEKKGWNEWSVNPFDEL